MSFRFKQFFIEDSQCAMKVGTDGVLLGCWAKPNYVPFGHVPCTILDVGIGSGLIARMMMQRCPEAKVEGIEVRGQLLHAGTLGFIHPSTGEYLEFHSELPEVFETVLAKLRK